MGLSLRAFNGIEKCDIQTYEAHAKFLNCAHLVPNDMIFNQSCGLSGYYTYSGEYMAFSTGSYSGYGVWRRMLADMIGYDIESLWSSLLRESVIDEILGVDEDIVNIPFIELIYFSDCEGFIGPEVSKKLYDDFVYNRDKALGYSISKKNSDWFGLYNDLIKAFGIASRNGCVQFC